MTNKELITLLTAHPRNAELLIDIGDRYAEIKSIKLEYSTRTDGKKPYLIISFYE